VAEVGKLDDKPNDSHNGEGDEEKKRAEDDVEEAFDVARVPGERGDVDAQGWCVTDELELAKLRGKGGFVGDEVIDDVAVDRLLIDVFGLAFVGLKDDVGPSVAEGVFDGGVLLIYEVLGEVFAGGNDADELIAGLWCRGDEIGKVVGVFAIPYYYRAKGTVAVAKAQVADETENGAIEHEEKEAKNERVDSNGANWEKVGRAEEVEGNDSHDANDGGDEKVANFPAARLTSENVFRIKAEGSQDDNPDRDEKNNF